MIVFFNYYVQRMSNYFISQLLVCMLMLLALLRILISNRKQEDSLVIFAPAAFFMSLIMVPAFGLTLSILLLIVESALIFIVNIPSLNRYSQKLYIDSFSPAYITFTSILSILFVLLTVFIFEPPRTRTAYSKRACNTEHQPNRIQNERISFCRF